MTSEALSTALERLLRRLATYEPDNDTELLLTDMLEDAESDLLLYLNSDALPNAMLPKVISLAELRYRKNAAVSENGAVTSETYSEGDVRFDKDYAQMSAYDASEQAIFDSVAGYREVRVK